MAQQQERQKEEEKLIGSQIPTRDQQQLPLTGFAILLILSFVGMALFLTSGSAILHQVPQNHVGAYWRGGALMKTLTHPGSRVKLPWTEFRPMQVIVRLDAVRNVPCTTGDGVKIRFEKIEVVSRLPKEHVYEVLLEHGPDYYKTLMLARVRQKAQEICSIHPLKDLYLSEKLDSVGEELKSDLKAHCSRAPGLQIWSVGVHNTIIPERIETAYKRAYKRLEEKRVKGLIEAEMQRMDEFQAEFQAEVRMHVEAEGGANCTESEEMYLEFEEDEEIEEDEDI